MARPTEGTVASKLDTAQYGSKNDVSIADSLPAVSHFLLLICNRLMRGISAILKLNPTVLAHSNVFERIDMLKDPVQRR